MRVQFVFDDPAVDVNYNSLSQNLQGTKTVAKAAAQDLISAKVSRFGAGDTMPAAMQQAWWKQMLAFVRNPSEVDSILNALESTAKSVYQ